MNKVVQTLCIFFLANISSQAQDLAPSYRERVNLIHKNIYREFYDAPEGLFLETNDSLNNEKPHSYLWPVCALVQAANEMEELDTSGTYMEPVMRAIDQYYNSNPPAPGYQAYVVKEEADARFYDDNQWIAIAYLDAYNRTGQKKYLDLSREIYRFMLTGYDEVSGGGLYWKEGDKTTKNTCSNGPGILVALQLYKITKETGYLDTAKLLYDWTNKYLRSPDGIYYDAVKLPGLKIDSAAYTYNTGTMLQSNVLFYRITGNKNYLVEAKRIADAAEKHFYKNGKLPGNYWFNAVLLRGLLELYQAEGDRRRLKFFVSDAERIWKQERDERNMLGTGKVRRLIDQAAMLEIYALLARHKLSPPAPAGR
jgi:hypothetical protein